MTHSRLNHPKNNIMRDELYADPRRPVGDFAFDESVAKVFPDMIERSVPCYRNLIEMIGILAGQFLKPGALCFDLGCSLGEVSARLLERHQLPGLRVIAVDNSSAMIAKLRTRMATEEAAGRLEPVCADLDAVDTRGASLVILNLTLQFVPPDARLALLARWRQNLVPGGGLILAEKIRLPDQDADGFLNHCHAEFKRANGYSELEISRKRAALDRVLLPDTPVCHRERLAAAGFRHVVPWFQCLNFMAWAAWN